MSFEVFFTEICQQLKQENLPFLVLRNYEKLPYAFTNDVDLLVEPTNVARILQAITLLATKHQYHYKTTKRYHFDSLDIFDTDDNIIVKLDLFSGLSKGWISYITTQHMLSSKVPQNCFYIPNVECEIYALIMKEMFMYHSVREKYRAYLSEKLPLIDRKTFSNILKQYLSASTSHFIQHNLDNLCDIKHKPSTKLQFSIAPIKAIQWLCYAIKDKSKK